MFTLLVAVDGSDCAARALAHALHWARELREPPAVHLLNVQAPVPFRDIKRFVGQDAINAYYHDEGAKALSGARATVAQSGVDATFHIAVGPVPETIVDYAREHGCGQIVMGARGAGSLSGLLLGSVAAKVLHLAHVPVTLVK